MSLLAKRKWLRAAALVGLASLCGCGGGAPVGAGADLGATDMRSRGIDSEGNGSFGDSGTDGPANSRSDLGFAADAASAAKPADLSLATEVPVDLARLDLDMNSDGPDLATATSAIDLSLVGERPDLVRGGEPSDISVVVDGTGDLARQIMAGLDLSLGELGDGGHARDSSSSLDAAEVDASVVDAAAPTDAALADLEAHDAALDVAAPTDGIAADSNRAGDLAFTGDGASAFTNSGDCISDADCVGGACVELSPGGFRTCAVQPVAATMCMSMFDQCCSSADCDPGVACLTDPLVPRCGGALFQPYNTCGVDQCNSDGDCSTGELCIPAGVLARKVRTCLPAACKLDGDCTDQPQGRCEPVDDSCCGEALGLYCIYPNGGCRTDDDCSVGHCDVSGSDGVCTTGIKVCPG